MSQQKQFEGPNVKALLEEIRTAYGEEPTIARAETFRTGGVLGFFQREHFRLVVDDQPAVAAPAGPRIERGPADLARAAYAAVTGGDRRDLNGSTVSIVDHPSDDLFELLADQTEDSFEAVADSQLVAAHAAAAAAVRAPAGEAPRPESKEGGSFEDVLRRVATMVDQPVGKDVVWPSVAEENPDKATDAAAVPPTAPVEPVVEEVGSVGDTPLVNELPVSEEQAERRLALFRAGFDPDTAVEIDGEAGYASLESSVLSYFESIPAAPALPRRKGSLIVVVGSGGRAMTEAARIAGEVGTDPATVAFASRRPPAPGKPENLMIQSVDDAHEIAPGHRRDRIGVVAVDAPVGTISTAWARPLIGALRPTQVIGVVDAMYKNEDVDAWASCLGGVDALIVDNVESTVSPARILEIDIPVSRLDEQVASPARWTATVLDRVAAHYGDAE